MILSAILLAASWLQVSVGDSWTGTLTLDQMDPDGHVWKTDITKLDHQVVSVGEDGARIRQSSTYIKSVIEGTDLPAPAGSPIVANSFVPGGRAFVAILPEADPFTARFRRLFAFALPTNGDAKTTEFQNPPMRMIAERLDGDYRLSASEPTGLTAIGEAKFDPHGVCRLLVWRIKNGRLPGSEEASDFTWTYRLDRFRPAPQGPSKER